MGWADQLSHDLGPVPEPAPTAQRAFADALALAHHILAGRDDPAGGDHVVSIHDPDARRGMHGSYFTGYLLDVAMDADSQIITALDVLPGNGDEAVDTTALLHWIRAGNTSFCVPPARPCALQAQCLKQVAKTTGRMVVINDYAAEYATARQYARPPTAIANSDASIRPLSASWPMWFAAIRDGGHGIAVVPACASNIW